MVTIRKRHDRTEEFDADKLTASLRAAGAEERHVEEVVNMVEATPGMTVNEIRSLVSAELGRRDPAAAEMFDSTRRLRANLAENLASGMARLAEDDLAHLHVREGDRIDLVRGGRRVTLKATLAEEGVRGVVLGASDMEALGLGDGSKVAVRRHREG